MDQSIADLRREYRKKTLSESEVDLNPIIQFKRWFSEALAAEVVDPNAMTLATCGASGMPSARVVLLKGFDERGFSFFTNYNSNKARQLEENPRAALVFWWFELERQVVIRGTVEKTSAEESEAYFRSRPRESQLSAWASAQGEEIPDRITLARRLEEVNTSFSGKDIPRPPYWGGYRLTPISVEFWQGGPGRLHDRLEYARQQNNSWSMRRLSP